MRSNWFKKKKKSDKIVTRTRIHAYIHARTRARTCALGGLFHADLQLFELRNWKIAKYGHTRRRRTRSERASMKPPPPPLLHFPPPLPLPLPLPVERVNCRKPKTAHACQGGAWAAPPRRRKPSCERCGRANFGLLSVHHGTGILLANAKRKSRQKNGFKIPCIRF